MAAVLAVSSHPQRTSPVLRGKWMLEAILGTPPPPPPPNVPALAGGPVARRPIPCANGCRSTGRIRHVRRCHSRIDPLGFALENYDVLGRWRTEEAGKPIDAKGELPDGTKFDGPDQLKAVLLEKKGPVPAQPDEQDAGVRVGARPDPRRTRARWTRSVAEVERNDYSAHSLIDAIVLSTPFRYQTGAVPRAPDPKQSDGNNTEEKHRTP